MRSNKKASRVRPIHCFIPFVAMAGVFATIVTFSNTRAAVPPEQALRFCIDEEGFINYGLKRDENGNSYTDYEVHFTATINGEDAGEWDETRRAVGGHSQYGWSTWSCTDRSCTEITSGGLPEKIPSQSNADAALQKYCMARCIPDLDKACKLLDDAENKAKNVASEDPDLKTVKDDLKKNIEDIEKATCERKDVGKLLDTAIAKINEADPKQSPSDRTFPVFKAAADFKEASKLLGCAGPCPEGTREKTAAEERDIEEAKKDTENKIKENEDEISREEKKGNSTRKLSDKNLVLKKILSAWDQLKAASCVPPDLMTATGLYIRDKRNFPGLTGASCNVLCRDLMNWHRDLTGQDEPQKTVYQQCLAWCE